MDMYRGYGGLKGGGGFWCRVFFLCSSGGDGGTEADKGRR